MDHDTSKERRAYTVGFMLSILLTLMPFAIVRYHTLSGGFLVAALVAFAILQLITQLVFFLHMGDEAKPRLRGMAFVFMALVVGILVIGSLWIMEHLDYHMDSPQEVERQLDQLDESDDL